MAQIKKAAIRKRKAEAEKVTRKSLMISIEAHAHLMDMAEKFSVSQPELVEALIKSADKSRLTAALAAISAERDREASESAEKKSLMKEVMDSMSADDLRRLLGK